MASMAGRGWRRCSPTQRASDSSTIQTTRTSCTTPAIEITSTSGSETLMERTTDRDRLRGGPLWAGLIGVVCGLGPAAHGLPAQDTSAVLVRVEDRARVTKRDRVVIRDPRTHQDRELYRSAGHIPDAVALAPDGRFVAFVEIVTHERVPEERFVVADLSGRVVRAFAGRHIRQAVWCCATGQIALLRGGGEGSTFIPETVSIVDVEGGAERALEGIWLPQQIAWAAFDSSLYIKGAPPASARGKRNPQWPVYRYQLASGPLSVTTHRGVYFSPDGAYYFDPSVEGSGFHLYRTADDQEVTARLQITSEQAQFGPEGGWAPGAPHLLVFVERPAQRTPAPGQPRGTPHLIDPRAPQVYPDRWNRTVDAETGRVTDRFQGDISAGWKTDAAALPLERRSGVDVLRFRRP